MGETQSSQKAPRRKNPEAVAANVAQQQPVQIVGYSMADVSKYVKEFSGKEGVCLVVAYISMKNITQLFLFYLFSLFQIGLCWKFYRSNKGCL